MHKNVYNTRKRYRQRARERFSFFIKACLVVLIISLIAIWVGKNYGSGQTGALKQKLSLQDKDIEALQEELLSARANSQTAMSRYVQLREEISKELPNEGPLRELVSLIRTRLDEGMDPERLRFILKSARPPRNCVDAATKRFVVITPNYKGPESGISLGESDVISVAGKGQAAKNNEGQDEAWFDPAKPVSITFSTNSGLTETKEGVFPIYHSLVVGDKEYRFTIDEGTQSFAKVTFDHCDYP